MKKAITKPNQKRGRVRNFIERTCDEEQDLKMMQPLLNTGIKHAEWAAKCIRNLRRRATRYELIVAKFLWREGVQYIAQCPFQIEGKTFFADFYIPANKTVVEIDGKGHSEGWQYYYDKERDYLMEGEGLTVVRITNDEVASGDYKAMIPFPAKEFLVSRLIYLPEGEVATGRERIRRILGY